MGSSASASGSSAILVVKRPGRAGRSGSAGRLKELRGISQAASTLTTSSSLKDEPWEISVRPLVFTGLPNHIL